MYRQKYRIYPFALILIPAMYFSVILMSITFVSTTNTSSLPYSCNAHIDTYTPVALRSNLVTAFLINHTRASFSLKEHCQGHKDPIKVS